MPLQTDRQREILKCLGEHSYRKTAAKFNVSNGTISNVVRKVKRNAARMGYAPEHDMTYATTEPFVVKGTSTYYNRDGEIRGQWVKTMRDPYADAVIVKEIIDSMKDEIPRVKVPDFHRTVESDDIIPWFNIGDAHIGALAHASEIGSNNDIKITVEELVTAMESLIDNSPICKRCVINDLGDMTHYQDFKAESESGHKFDYDTRYPKMIKAYVYVMRRLIDYALDKFQYVDVIINQGNHSRSNDIFMKELLTTCYEKCDRLNVLDNSNVFIPYRMGNTFVMTHHGDKAKHSVLSGVMATDYAKDWGESKYRYIWTGHIHHREVLAKEQAGVMIESWNTMSRGDAYSHMGGWRNRKFLSVVFLSKTYGEVGRKTIPIEQVQDILERKKSGSTSKSIQVYRV